MKRGVIAGLVAGAAYAAWRFLKSRRPDTGGVVFEPAPFPSPPRPVLRPSQIGKPQEPVHPGLEFEDASTTNGSVPSESDQSAAAWVEPVNGTCPTSHPVKAKVASRIFHVPGGASFDRTQADRCYLNSDAAEADGLRAAKR